MGSVCTLHETRMTFWLRDWDTWIGKKSSFTEVIWSQSTDVLVLRCGWDVVRRWDIVVESTHIFKVLNGEENKLRQQTEASAMLILVIICSIQKEKSCQLMKPGNGFYCGHHGLLDLFFLKRSLIKSETFYNANILLYMCSIQWKFHWILFTVRDQYLPGTALENAVVHTY